MSAAAAASIRARRRTSSSRSASASASTAPRSPTSAGWWPRSTAPPCRTASTSICTASSSPTTGKWVVVQQGMNDASRHGAPLSLAVRGAARASSRSRTRRSTAPIRARSSTSPIAARDASRRGQLELLSSLGPDGIARELAAHRGQASEARCPPDPAARCRISSCPPITTCARATCSLRRLHATLRRGGRSRAADFAELLLVPGVGARTVRALAMVAEVVHGAPCRFTDPARFSLAHGGKDRHPFPVPLKVYDETIAVHEGGGAEGEARRRTSGSPRSSGSTTRPAASSDARPARPVDGRDRRGAPALACLRRPQRVRLGAGAGGASARR